MVDRSVGYAVVTRDGEVYVFGDTGDFGDTPMVDATAIVLKPGGGGYWVVQSNGVVHAFGDAEHLGNAEQSWLLPGEAITTMAASTGPK